MIKFNSFYTINFFNIFSFLISDINRNANTSIRYFKNTSVLLNIDILQSPTQSEAQQTELMFSVLFVGVVL